MADGETLGTRCKKLHDFVTRHISFSASPHVFQELKCVKNGVKRKMLNCYLAVYTRIFAARHFEVWKKPQPASRRLEIGDDCTQAFKSLRMERVFSDQGVVSHKSFSTILNLANALHKS